MSDQWRVTNYEDRIEFVPMAQIPRDQLWYWTPEWQAKERQADEDIRCGRVKKNRGACATIKALKSIAVQDT